MRIHQWTDMQLPETGWLNSLLMLSKDDGWVGGEELLLSKNSLLTIVVLAIMMLSLTTCELGSAATPILPTPVSVIPTASPLPTPTATATPSPTQTPVPTPTETPTAAPTITPCPFPTPGGPVGQIVFSAVECVGDYCEPFAGDVAPIYLINSGGSGMRQIYRGTGVIGALHLSPDGTKLAFSDSYYVDINEQRYSSGNVYVLDLASGRAWPVAPDDPSQRTWGLRWVSNEMLIYASEAIEPADSSSNIYLTDVQGEWHHQLTSRQVGRTSILDIAVSPDGTQLVFAEFVLDSDMTTIYRINVDGTGLMELIAFPGVRAANVAWSPTGDRMVIYPITLFAEYVSVYEARSDGTGVTEVASLPASLPGSSGLLAWTQDQTGLIFYVCNGTLGINQIVEVQSDGSVHPLATVEIPGVPSSTTPCSRGDLSPDRQRFAFHPLYISDGEKAGLYMMDIPSGCGYQILSGYRVQSMLWLPMEAPRSESR